MSSYIHEEIATWSQIRYL